MFQKFITWVSNALSESPGNPSSLRPPFWYHELILGICLLGIVAFTCASFWVGKEFNPLPIGGVLTGWFTVNRGSKQLQKITEGQSNTTTP